MSWWLWLITALIPMFVGALYYSPLLVGNHWMKVNGFTEEYLREGNMVVTFITAYLGGIIISMIMTSVVIHQTHVFSILIDEPGFGEAGSEVQNYFEAFIAKYGTNYRTFKHGAFHGLFTGLFLVAPIIMINARFERRSWQYIAIHAGYWMITLTLVGGTICAFMQLV